MPAVGKPAPNFELTAFDGRKIRLADLKGHVVLLNFWATWCGPCKQEMPLLSAYYKAMHERGGDIEIFAVATEDSLSPKELSPVQAVVTFPMIKRFSGHYGVAQALPMNFVIDRYGVLRYARAGALTLDSMNAVLSPLRKGGIAHLAEAYVYLGLSKQTVGDIDGARNAFGRLKDVPGISPRVLRLWTLYAETQLTAQNWRCEKGRPDGGMHQ